MIPIDVLKFGGSSVKSIGRIKHVCQIIAERCLRRKLVVVVSAMGDTTDYLCKLAQLCTTDPDRRELDMLLATGEQMSIALLAMTLRAMGVRARSFTGPQLGIVTDGDHTSARIRRINANVIHAALLDHDVIVVAGFQGVTESGDITTLGRGGSDTTAVALAIACDSKECDIYTDVDGVYTADPNRSADARLLRTLSYYDMLSLAQHGAQVLHLRSVELATRYRIKLRVRNTFKADDPGTLVEGSERMETLRTALAV